MWIITRAEDPESASFAALVLATPAAETGGLLRGVEPSGPRFGALLGKIEYASMAQVSAGYRVDQIKQHKAKDGLNGFGFPRPAQRKVAAARNRLELFPVPRTRA